ncbi:MAG TPA: peptidoglycan bridge formation glycyltransferase FemA/FemB family protein [Candidatus Eisenbacteria bacterium]|nr:peptidoglycan bridge formation glycyltransferase FemA/FemB family protein [Candidatus Eisenbacteria bacterium]
MALTVRPISREEHLGFITSRPAASFLQCPSWGEVKREWRHESIGWYDEQSSLTGTGLVLYRQVPKVKKFLAYLPEGPVIDWTAGDLEGWLAPMTAYLQAQGAFGVKMGPPVVRRRWSAATVKAAIAANSAKRLADVPPDHTDPAGERVAATLRRLGWREPSGDGGFSAGQPQYVFQVPLAGRDEDELLKGFNQLWRRNIKKAAKSGVKVTQGGPEDLPAFHALYLETAQRDGFTGRPLSYFQHMWSAMAAEDPDRIRLYLAHHEGDLVAATTMVRVGTHAWYSYGASSTDKRDVRGSNAIQWQMLRDAREAGATVYDLRGITDTLDEGDPHFGLIQFKLGTGGEAVEYLGEWDLPLNRLLFKAFDLYMSRR